MQLSGGHFVCVLALQPRRGVRSPGVVEVREVDDEDEGGRGAGVAAEDPVDGVEDIVHLPLHCAHAHNHGRRLPPRRGVCAEEAHRAEAQRRQRCFTEEGAGEPDGSEGVGCATTTAATASHTRSHSGNCWDRWLFRTLLLLGCLLFLLLLLFSQLGICARLDALRHRTGNTLKTRRHRRPRHGSWQGARVHVRAAAGRQSGTCFRHALRHSSAGGRGRQRHLHERAARAPPAVCTAAGAEPQQCHILQQQDDARAGERPPEQPRRQRQGLRACTYRR
mmetsp:Transcript_65499/g.213246  ORF Transcript_65499/g.213246 Transcript_65499/m.213246 type:complete len:278 (-) Transcript_65499:55-888(-)